MIEMVEMKKKKIHTERPPLLLRWQILIVCAVIAMICGGQQLLTRVGLPQMVRTACGALLLLLIYVILGATLPFLRPKRLTAAEEAALSEKSVYGAGSGERVLTIEGNQEALCWRLRLFRNARRSIIYSTMDFRNDHSGVDVLSALFAAAERGVRVRLLVDGLRSLAFLQSREFRTFLLHENIEVRGYNPLNLRKPWRLQARLHDKYIIVDDEVYTIGGRNTNDLFLGEYGRGRRNIDRELLVWDAEKQGASLSALKQYFETLWDSGLCRRIPMKRTPFLERNREMLRNHYQWLRKAYPEAFTPLDLRLMTMPAAKITLLHNAWTPYKKPPLLWKQMMAVLATGEDLLIQTPYLMLDSVMERDLQRLAAEPKRRVRVVTNAVETGANAWGCADYLNRRSRILRIGMELFECVSSRSCHLKSILVDERLSLVGSFNFDMRSCYLDTELMLAVDCPALNQKLRQYAQKNIEESRHVTADGLVGVGTAYQQVSLSVVKYLLYTILRLLIFPIRYLL